MDINELRNLYAHLEKTKITLQTQLLKEEKIELMDLQTPGLPGAECEYSNGVLKFTFPDKLPMLSKSDHYDREMFNLWGGQLAHAYCKLEKSVSFQRAMCVIRITDKDTTFWDVDNRNIRHIINALRINLIIEEDKWENLSVAVIGNRGRENKTEVFIFDHAKIDALLSEICS